MAEQQSRDIRLTQALELLRSIIEDNGADAVNAADPLYFAPVPPPDPEGRLSATDILSWWFRPPSRHRPGWDEYFRPFPAATSSRPPWVPHEQAPVIPAPPNLRQPAPATGIPSWTAIRAFLPETEVALADDDADAAVEGLYEFLHAVARRDVAAAMKLVSEDYHSFEDDREVDRACLQRRIEGLLDTLEDCELEASLSMAPEPLFHANGILIYAEIQIDAQHRRTDERRTIIDRKMAVFERQGDGAWKIATLSPAQC